MSVIPVFAATWSFGAKACSEGRQVLAAGGTALDAVEKAGMAIELDPEVMSVGYGGLPNSEGVVELDAAIMDGLTHAAGAVGAMTGIRTPIAVARRVMEKTVHTMLGGNNARRFAIRQGFADEDLQTAQSREAHAKWRRERTAADVAHFRDQRPDLSHDTVGLCALDTRGNLAAGCTTSGMSWKTPGRIGDSPIVGSGLYADNEVGCAAATGNGDEIMKVCLSYRVVMLMQLGRTAQEACEEALRYLLAKRPNNQGRGAACIAIRKDGDYGAAATQEGFGAPDRLWIHNRTEDGKIVAAEGPYVTLS
jgi:L-asparaginase/N4-(beta-N-acetylglucosaminyl)-L-asparaginase